MSQFTSPDAWTGHMRHGDFEGAWAISDAVLERRRGTTSSHLPRHQQWIWDGTPLRDQRVLVRCYHGLGDTIQFIRYVPLLKAIASRVIVWMQEPLIPLFAGMAGIDELLPLHDGVPECDYDVDVEVMELPHIFRTTVETIPRAVPYVRAIPSPLWSPALRQAQGRPEPGRGAALAGSGGRRSRNDLAVLVFPTSGNWDRRRDLPIEARSGLVSLPGLSFYALKRDGWAQHRRGLTVLDIPDTIEAAAGVLAAVDLVVSIDSMPAHLAGAMGVPVWTLLHADADWRWMEGRDDSPWYPSMRLFRQPASGQWSAVVEAVRAALTRRSPAALAAPSRPAVRR